MVGEVTTGGALVLGGSDILFRLVQMPFRGLTCFGILLFDAVLGEHRPPHESFGLDGVDPCGLDGIHTYRVHPLDSLLG